MHPLLTLWLCLGAFFATVGFLALLIGEPSYAPREARDMLRSVGVVNPRVSIVRAMVVIAVIVSWIEVALAWPWFVYEIVST